MAGAPFGNHNAAKGKRWSQAIERAIQRRSGGKDMIDALDELADQFLAAVVSGNKDTMPGYKEIGDRLEGKPMQPTEVSGPEGVPLSIKVIGLPGGGD